MAGRPTAQAISVMQMMARILSTYWVRLVVGYCRRKRSPDSRSENDQLNPASLLWVAINLVHRALKTKMLCRVVRVCGYQRITAFQGHVTGATRKVKQQPPELLDGSMGQWMFNLIS